jgi:hypothetical protein
LSTLVNEPIYIDVDNTEDWSVIIEDIDLETGDEIPHTGETLSAVVKDADGNTLFTADSGSEISLVPGTTNQIQITVPYSITSTWPAAQYYGSLVIVVSATSRRKIVDLVFRHEVK